MPINTLFKNPNPHLKATLRIVNDDEPIFGPGRLQLLEHIEQTGSINQAAKNMGMSYKKAWQMISSMNEHAQKPLILTQTGGNSGGGAVITPEGKILMNYYRDLRLRFQAFLDEETKKLSV
jgi:molybdate transport system regulatory protein